MTGTIGPELAIGMNHISNADLSGDSQHGSGIPTSIIVTYALLKKVSFWTNWSQKNYNYETGKLYSRPKMEQYVRIVFHCAELLKMLSFEIYLLKNSSTLKTCNEEISTAIRNIIIRADET